MAEDGFQGGFIKYDGGGNNFIRASKHSISKSYDKRSRWTGQGLGSLFIKALNEAYSNVVKAPTPAAPVKVAKSLPMNFVYGEGTALPSRADVKSKTTFDAILAGERTSTSRKDGSLNKNSEKGLFAFLKRLEKKFDGNTQDISGNLYKALTSK